MVNVMGEGAIDQDKNFTEKIPEVKEDAKKVECLPCEEAEKTLAMRASVMPSKKEVEEHELPHCPYRAWCDHCVRGKRKMHPTGL